MINDDSNELPEEIAKNIVGGTSQRTQGGPSIKEVLEESMRFPSRSTEGTQIPSSTGDDKTNVMMIGPSHFGKTSTIKEFLEVYLNRYTEYSSFLFEKFATRLQSEEESWTDQKILHLRWVNEGISLRALALTLSTLVEIHTKCWLIEQGRFTHLIEYSQTHDTRFENEAELIIKRIAKNSPTILELLAASASIAVGMKLLIDAVAQTPLRFLGKKLSNDKVALDLKLREQEAEIARAKDTQAAELEKEKTLLELERQRIETEKTRVELERQLLDLQKEQFEFLVQRRDYAEKAVKVVVSSLRSDIDDAARNMLVQTLLPDVLQLGQINGLEIVDEQEKPPPERKGSFRD